MAKPDLPNANAPTCRRCQTAIRLVTHLMGEPLKDNPRKFAFFAAFECPSCGLVTFLPAGDIPT